MSQRQRNLERLSNETFNVVIIGGGINGAVSAAALSARGVKVALIDARDFAGFTSQHSSNLIWGGIKYMESYELSLVANLCKSRNELMRAYPSMVKEIRFLTTISEGFRHHPLTLLAGSWLYWLFGRGQTKGPRLFSAKGISKAEPMINTSDSAGGVEYSDAYLVDNDARFVLQFIRRAWHNQAALCNYVNAEQVNRDDQGMWQIQAHDSVNDHRFNIKAKALINAGGAFVDELNQQANITTQHRHVFSKGIHLIVPRITENERVLAFFADDGRLFFAIPMGHRTCIGTTDTRVDSPHSQVDDEDREFVLNNINHRLKLAKPLSKSDIIGERCGVRPLVVENQQNNAADFLQLSRKHIIEVAKAQRHISIFGGKLTDCLNIGEEVCEYISDLGIPLSPSQSAWYGEPKQAEKQKFITAANALNLQHERCPYSGESFIDRLWRRYDNDAYQILERIQQEPAALSRVYDGIDMRACEKAYMEQHEMVVTEEDLLRRRTKTNLIR